MLSHLPTSTTVVFSDPHYPQLCASATLPRLVPGSFQTANAAELPEALAQGCTLLVSFHGAYFPKTAWSAVLGFLERGGNLAVFGGMPFTRPVTDDRQIEPAQDAYTRQIYLGPFFQVPSTSTALQLVAHEDAALLRDCPLCLTSEDAGTFWSFHPKLTQISDHPDESGSAGPFDTHLLPLIFAQGHDAYGEKLRVATPVSLLEQRSGRFKGGRWLLSPWLPATEEDWLRNAEALHRLLLLTAQGATTCEARPTLGCYQPGEVAALLVTVRTGTKLHVRVTVCAPDSQQALQTFAYHFPASALRQEQVCTLAPQQQPGLYRFTVEYQPEDGQPLALEGGFWMWDAALVAATRQLRLTAGRDYFFQGEQPFLICGTTYMDSQVQRKFLHLPNPARWDRELAEMKAAGINLIRTGIWTAWREFMPLAGVANEAFLRALDAFVMAACKQQMQVIFTFFSFFPTLFEGENPWLDPRSVEAQQDFVGLLARRYAEVELLSWDLINEPSFGDPARIFAQRPLPHYDRFEIAAFQQWLAERYTLSELQLRWRLTSADLPTWAQVLPPQESDYNTSVRETTVRAMLKVGDYTRFSQEMFQGWATQMVTAIRATGCQTLVGVGQDESASRISPQFYAQSVDYTTTHPWWNIDDMLWDMLLDKTPEKPNLIQETGVMQLRDIDGLPWRNAQANADLLERKLITGLIARGAGLIQWLWHTNGYMTSDNENSIGLVHADGSAKPELAVQKEFGRLVRALNGRLEAEPSSAEVWLVLPYSQWFLRPDLARFSTQQAVRVLGHDLGILPQLIGEHQLESLLNARQQPRVVIVPALHYIDPQAWRQLLTYVQRGGQLLVSGCITRDAHNLPFDPALPIPTDGLPEPVSRYETLTDATGQIYQVTFGDEKISYVKKMHNRVYQFNYGAGTLTWCGLPLELASDATTTRVLYAPIVAPGTVPQSNSPVLISTRVLKDGHLTFVVSEASQPQQIKLEGNLTVTIAPNRAGALLVNLDGQARPFGGLVLRS
jgi:hypothetical protein